MNTLSLQPCEHAIKRGYIVPAMQPTVVNDALLSVNDEVIGFYLKRIPDSLADVIRFADAELRSSRVPKSKMQRNEPLKDEHGLGKKNSRGKWMYSKIDQYSCILGSIPRKPHMRRNYETRSSVHLSASAKPFVKAMIVAGCKALDLVKDITPDVYRRHVAAVTSAVPEKWRFAKYFTSSISNVNTSAPVHRDNYNVKGGVNVIITVRRDANGGDLFVPDLNAVFQQSHLSLLVYPAWRNSHGVTPIEATRPGGYRNSLVWYALDLFRGQKV